MARVGDDLSALSLCHEHYEHYEEATGLYLVHHLLTTWAACELVLKPQDPWLSHGPML